MISAQHGVFSPLENSYSYRVYMPLVCTLSKYVPCSNEKVREVKNFFAYSHDILVLFAPLQGYSKFYALWRERKENPGAYNR